MEPPNFREAPMFMPVLRRDVALLAGALLIAGCVDTSPAGPARANPLLSAAAAPGVTALTWNVYVGAEIERVVQARTPEEAVALATEEWARVRATNFPARAGALAGAIAARRPHVVGLEELALYRTTDHPFQELATQVAYDFLQLVLDSLHARGLDYTAAAVDRTTDIQVPVIAGFDDLGRPIFQGVRFTDGDAALVRAAGFDDSWMAPERQAPGLTCCEQPDLLNRQQTFDQRIDFIFTRNVAGGTPPVGREVVGDRPGERTAAGLWPSDHAGVAATIL